MKRSICLLLAVLCLFGVFTLAVSAASETLVTEATAAKSDPGEATEAPSEDASPSGIKTAFQNVILPGALFLIALIAGYFLGKKYTKKK